jgi:hypothetical protein
MSRHFAWPLLFLLLPACFFGGDGDDDGAVPPDAMPRADARPPGLCNDVSMDVTPAAGTHIPEGEPIGWPTNPPSGGAHYPKWVKWAQTYDPGVDRGYWVHNTEHGGVVLLYNCPGAGGCPDVVAGLEALVDALPADPKCSVDVRTRTLISADPLLPAGVQVAASAWGAYYTAECLDAESLRAFVVAHYAMGPEDTCSQGSVP